MENEKTLDTLASHLEHNASVKNVYGEPVTADGKTIIPVAKIAFGLGGGFGEGKPADGKHHITGEGPKAGAGGGMYATPRGVYEISQAGTKFIPADNLRQFFMGLAAGFLIRAVLSRLSRRKA